MPAITTEQRHLDGFMDEIPAKASDGLELPRTGQLRLARIERDC
jgi:hypothetical protein